MISVVESNADKLSGTRDRSKPIRLRSLRQPTLICGLGEKASIVHQRFIYLARFLKPPAVHVQPRQLIQRTLPTVKDALKIQQVLVVKKSSHAWRSPTVSVPGGESYDFHYSITFSPIRAASGGPSLMITYNSFGPWTPMASVNSMSAVREGPVMKVMVGLTAEGSPRRTAANASPSVKQMLVASIIAICTGGTSDTRRCLSDSDSSTKVPVSAIAACAVLTPTS